MFSIAGRVLDVYDDLKKDLLRSNLEKVGALRLDPPDKVSALSDDQFAGIFLTKTGRAIRKYPVHTPDAVVLSRLYFENVADELPKEACAIIRDNLSRAATRHSLPGAPATLEKSAGSGNLIDLRSMSGPMPKIASSGHFALENHYPIDSTSQIKQASAYFEEHCMQFEPVDRFAFASNVLRRAGELGEKMADVSEIHKYAGADFGNLVQSAFHERTCLLDGDDMAIRALQTLFEKRASLNPEEFAAELETFDRSNRLDRHWDRARGIRDPYRSTFENVKIARVIKVGSASITQEQLQQIVDSGMLKEAFSDTFCNEFAEAPMEIFQSLPKPEQQIIVEMAGEL